MKGNILLNYNENTKIVEDEEKLKFLKDLLDQMGVPTAEIWGDDISLSIEQTLQLKKLLSTYNVYVIDDLDGGMKIYVDNELIGEWHKCSYKIKRDLAEIDRKKQLYLEMEINCWTIFEQQEQ